MCRRWSSRACCCSFGLGKLFFGTGGQAENDKVRLTYIGRTEPGKGIEEVIYLYNHLKDQPRLEIAIHGFHHEHSQAGVCFTSG